MDNDPGILCFRHCPIASVFCKNIPDICPACSLEILTFIVDPFRIPYPITNAIHNPTSIVIRPSQGSFLDDYDIMHDLHIGIVNSMSIVLEFDKCGLIINDASKWTECIALKVIQDAWIVQWDETLLFMLRDSKWKPVNYNETSLNCFSFVLEFFNILGHTDFKFVNKEDLCEKLILSKIKNLIKYKSLYMPLKDRQYLLVDN